MPSTFTDALGLELQATGENTSTWGVINNSVIDDLDDAIAARLALSVAGSSDVTLTAAQSLHAYHEYTGTLTGNINVIVPATEKLFFIFNNTTGAFTLTVKTSAGTGILVPQATRAILYCDGTNVVDTSSAIGKQTEWIPAKDMTPTVSNGCAALASVETTAGRPDMNVLDFDAATDEFAQFQIAFPKGWDKGTVTYKAYWTVSAAVTTGVAISLQGAAISDGDTIDAFYGSAVIVTDDALGTAEDLSITAESSAITIGGTPADDDICYFRIFRDVSDPNDDMTQDMRLIGIKLFYSLTRPNDT